MSNYAFYPHGELAMGRQGFYAGMMVPTDGCLGACRNQQPSPSLVSDSDRCISEGLEAKLMSAVYACRSCLISLPGEFVCNLRYDFISSKWTTTNLQYCC